MQNIMTRLHILTIFIVLCSVSFAQHQLATAIHQVSIGNPFSRVSGLLDTALSLQERVARAEKGCAVDTCFALDGNVVVGGLQFARAREFAQIIALITDVNSRARNAALQYGLANSPIANLTANATAFVADTTRASFAVSPVSFTSAGILGCNLLLRDGNVPSNQASGNANARGNESVIVVVGAGFFRFGVNPSEATNEIDARVLAAAVADANRTALAAVATNRNVVDIGNDFVLTRAVRSTVEFICKLPRA